MHLYMWHVEKSSCMHVPLKWQDAWNTRLWLSYFLWLYHKGSTQIELHCWPKSHAWSSANWGRVDQLLHVRRRHTSTCRRGPTIVVVMKQDQREMANMLFHSTMFGAKQAYLSTSMFHWTQFRKLIMTPYSIKILPNLAKLNIWIWGVHEDSMACGTTEICFYINSVQYMNIR